MQIKYHFDTETLKKILKGALISATGAGALYILQYVGALHFSNPSITAFVAFLVPFLVNLVKEWMSGVKAE